MGLFDIFKKKKKTEVLIDEKTKLPIVKTATEEKKEYIKTSDSFSFSVQTTLKEQELTYNPKNVEVKLEEDRLNVYIDGNYVGTGNNQAKTKFIEHCNKDYNIEALSIYAGGRTRIKIRYSL